MTAIKRFYKEVSLGERDGSFAIQLDGRTAKTAGRQDLAAPEALAEALREEWDAQDEEIRLDRMPLTRLHGFALDAGHRGREEFIATMVSYAGSDLLCYRASESDLAARQQQLFAPFLERAEADGLNFRMVEGIVPVEQPEETLDRLEGMLAERPITELLARKLLTEILGSVILASYAEKDPENAFAAARLDETYQAEAWGQDNEAAEKEKALRRDYGDVLRYLELAGSLSV
jgi:chaperone required for assembly of F1-ATPase